MLSKRITQLYQEQIERQEMENKRRVERLHQENLQKEQREKHLQERRRKAEEIFRKRVEENRKIQEMLNKRAREEQLVRAQMEQERKERLQKIIKKRSQDRKMQKQEEERKKKLLESKRSVDMLEVRYLSPENVKYKLELQKQAYIDWAKIQLKNQKARRKKDAHRKAKLERKLDTLLASKGFDLSRAPQKTQFRKISLPLQNPSNANLLVPQISQQDVMDLVSYTPAPTILDDKKVNHYDNRRQSKEGQLSNFEKYVAIPIKGKDSQKRTLPTDSRSISPEVSALLLHSALNSPHDSGTKRTTLLQSMNSNQKKASYNEAYFKNVRNMQPQEERMLQIYKAAPNVFNAKKKSTQEKYHKVGANSNQLTVKTSLGKDSLLFGDLSEQSPHFRRTTFPEEQSPAQWKERSPRSSSK